MRTSPLRHAAAAAAIAGALAFSSGPAAADPCYPPKAGCVPISVAPVTTTKPAVTKTVVVRKTAGGNLARTGAIVVPTALIGVGLVAAGVILKRSSGRDKASSKPA